MEQKISTITVHGVKMNLSTYTPGKKIQFIKDWEITYFENTPQEKTFKFKVGDIIDCCGINDGDKDFVTQYGFPSFDDAILIEKRILPSVLNQ